MLCRICKEDKLSQEFIPYSVTDKCQHPKLICLRCASKAADTKMCPFKGCGQAIAEGSYQIKEFRLMLHYLFEEVETTNENPPAVGKSNTIHVVMLTGKEVSLEFRPEDKVLALKRKIYKQLSVDARRQKLLYNEHELTDTLHGTTARIKDFGVKPNSTIYLIVLLYAVPSRLDHATFDLFWGYPKRKVDYLDASCLFFSGEQFIREVDYAHRLFTVTKPYSGGKKTYKPIYHSGDRMDDENKIGHHTIDVHFKLIPPYITHLFFILSSWNCPTIKYFKSPSLRFYDKSDPKTDLCNTSFTHAKSSQAVVMCSVSREGETWNIYDSGKLSNGNAKDYRPLIDTIQILIKRGV